MSDINVYTTSQITALTPITGDLVVDSDLNALKLYDGAVWITYSGTGALQAESGLYLNTEYGNILSLD